MLSARYRFAGLASAVDREVAQLVADDVAARFWERDSTVFGEEPTEIADRMGWFDAPNDSLDMWAQLEGFAAEVCELADDVIVMGMGGSSLFPEVLAKTFGNAPGHPRLHVLDSTDADAIRRVLAATDPSRSFYIASSKSGTTLETRSQLDLFWAASGDPERFAVITDPDSALERLADERGFAHVFRNDPDIGGRFAALSLFGMVPAAVLGVDGESILEASLDLADALEPLDDGDNVGIVLGAFLGAAAKAGREQLTVAIDPRIETFGLWLEQLVAESTGKHGVGVVPVIGEPLEAILASPQRRIVAVIGEVEGIDALRAMKVPIVELSLEETVDLGAHVLLWEYATAIAGRVLGLNPFDQPDVESAKRAARALMDADAPVSPEPVPLADALEMIEPTDTVAVCAFVDPDGVQA
ncbi:MAG: hypothetical protein GX868_17035, partial [Actinobacteria bacterium]|nr:hypothetical protein [Actinomycetota bacterium]